MPAPGPTLTAGQTMRWLSAPRYRRYLGVAGGNHALAMETYLWNSGVAAAGIVDVGHLEVALRNAYDRELSARFRTGPSIRSSRCFDSSRASSVLGHASTAGIRQASLGSRMLSGG